MALCIDCDAEVAREVSARMVRNADDATDARLRKSGLPRDYVTGDRKLGDLPMTTAAALTACQMLGDGLRGLFLFGDAGAYKTSVAAAYLAAQIRGGMTGRYVSMQDLLTDLYAIYAHSESTSRGDLVDALVVTPALVLDDMGKEKLSEHSAGVLFEILDGRYRMKSGWMIATSNFSMDEMCDRITANVGEAIGEPIRRRLAEMTVAIKMERR